MSDVNPKLAEDRHSALFAGVVFEWTQLGMMFLGQVPADSGAEAGVDLDHARLVIDQLEMLQIKTRGNLSAEETSVLNRGLSALRLAFVEAVDKVPAKPGEPPLGQTGPGPAPLVEAQAPAPETTTDESKVRYSKKYSA